MDYYDLSDQEWDEDLGLSGTRLLGAGAEQLGGEMIAALKAV